MQSTERPAGLPATKEPAMLCAQAPLREEISQFHNRNSKVRCKVGYFVRAHIPRVGR